MSFFIYYFTLFLGLAWPQLHAMQLSPSSSSPSSSCLIGNVHIEIIEDYPTPQIIAEQHKVLMAQEWVLLIHNGFNFKEKKSPQKAVEALRPIYDCKLINT